MYIDVQNLKNKMNVALYIDDDEKLLDMIKSIANDINGKTFKVDDLIIMSDYIVNCFISNKKHINESGAFNVLFTKVLDFFHYSIYINASFKENALLYKNIFNKSNSLIYNEMYENKCLNKDNYFIYHFLSYKVNEKEICSNDDYKTVMSLIHNIDNYKYVKMLYYINPEFLCDLKKTDEVIFLNYINDNKIYFSDIINEIIKMPYSSEEVYDIFHKETEELLLDKKDVSILNKNNANIIINNIVKHNLFNDEEIIKKFLKIDNIFLYKPKNMDYNVEIIDNAAALISNVYYNTNISPYHKNAFYNKFISMISESSNDLITEAPRYMNDTNKSAYDYYFNKFTAIMNFSINNELVDINILLKNNLLGNAKDIKMKFNIKPFYKKNKSQFLKTIESIKEIYPGKYNEKILKNVFDINVKNKLLSLFSSKENMYYFDNNNNENENLTLLIENKKEEVTSNNNEKENIAKLFDNEEIRKEIKEVINHITTTYEKIKILGIELNKDDDLFLQINAMNEYNYGHVS